MTADEQSDADLLPHSARRARSDRQLRPIPLVPAAIPGTGLPFERIAGGRIAPQMRAGDEPPWCALDGVAGSRTGASWQLCGWDVESPGGAPLLACDADSCTPTIVGPFCDYRAGDDLRAFGPMLWRDAQGVAAPQNLLLLGVSAAAAVGIRQDLDGQVRRATAEHPQRWGDASRFLGHLGEAPYQVPVLGACWGVSLWTDEPELHGLMSTVVSAYTISGLATLAIKGATDTERPDPDWNDGHWGFPSYHAASTFTIAAVLDEYYGFDVGLPAYTLAGLIGWSRIDERDHDLSDVVFGAAMGWVIGKSVAGTHLRGDGRVRIGPWVHPTDGAAGLLFDTRF